MSKAANANLVQNNSGNKVLKKSKEMNLSKVLGFTYFFVILALVSAVPKQYDANVEK